MAAAFHDSDPGMKFSFNSEIGNNIFRSFKLFLQKSPVLVPGREPFNFPPFQNFESEHPVVYAAAGFVPGTIHPIFEPMVQQNIVLLSDNVTAQVCDGGESRQKWSQCRSYYTSAQCLGGW